MNRHTRYLPALVALASALLALASPAAAQYSSVSVAGQSATNVTATSVLFTGSASIGPWGASDYFQYGTSSSYGSQTPTQGLTWSWQSETVGFSSQVTDLAPNTTYHYRAVVVDGNGWGTAYGGDATFTTPPAQTDGGLALSGPSAANVTHSYIGSTNGWIAADVPMLIASRWSRVWQIGTSGAISDTVAFGFDFPTGGVTTYGVNYMLLYRSGSSGYFTPLFVPTGTVTQGWAQFLVPASRLQPGEYTLGQAISGTIVQVPRDASTVQGGVNAAGGGVVLVAPGTYNERVNVGDNTVTIMSEFGITGDTSKISRTVIDGGGQGSVITAGDRNNGCTFIGLTVQNGSARTGGGAYMGIYSGSSWKYCYFFNNRASSQGGAFYSGSYGGNSFANCVFNGNSVNPGDGQSAYGGAICQTSYGNMSITSCSFTGNHANGYYNQGFQSWTGHGYGGAIDFDFFSYGSLSVSNSTFTDNVAQQSGGAIFNGGGKGGVTTYNCVFNGNYGGGTINGLTRKEGDGSAISSAGPVASGGAIFVEKGGRARIIQSTIYDTTAGDKSGGIRVDTGEVDVISSIVWTGNGSSAIEANHGLMRVAYSNVAGGWNGPGIGNLSVDPMFTDIAGGDFRLRPGSPSIDSGTPDADGDGLTWQSDSDDRDPDGSRIDMGALPYYREIPAGGAVAAVRVLTSLASPRGPRVMIAPSPMATAGILRYELAAPADVTIELVSALGERIATLVDGHREAGPQVETIDVSKLPAGVYPFRLRAGDALTTGRIVVAR